MPGKTGHGDSRKPIKGKTLRRTPSTERKHMEEALQKANSELEKKVEDRTSQLVKANSLLEQKIQELKQADEEKGKYTRELEESNRALQDFSFMASHDLQEPLRKILAFGNLLKSKAGDALDREARDYLERMQNAGRRMQELISSLLVYSRVIVKTEPLKPVDLGEVAREALSNLEVTLDRTGGRIELQELPVIEADHSQMVQLFQNLIGNALKFHREEVPPAVEIYHHMIPGDDGNSEGKPSRGSYCKIFVKDNGIGLSEKHYERIFRAFERLVGASQYPGTGMGLAICQKIVRRHGGSITVESEPGSGSVFMVTLPLKQPQPEKVF
jgi:light-regulated signal transduction histidine kinase (bacteriophytochrome)